MSHRSFATLVSFLESHYGPAGVDYILSRLNVLPGSDWEGELADLLEEVYGEDPFEAEYLATLALG